MKKYFFIELGLISCKAEQPLLMKYFKILSWGEGSGNKNKNPFNDQSNVADFYLWSLLPHDNPKHCVKKVRIRSYSDPYFPVFSPNAEKYGPE